MALCAVPHRLKSYPPPPPLKIARIWTFRFLIFWIPANACYENTTKAACRTVALYVIPRGLSSYPLRPNPFRLFDFLIFDLHDARYKKQHTGFHADFGYLRCPLRTYALPPLKRTHFDCLAVWFAFLIFFYDQAQEETKATWRLTWALYFVPCGLAYYPLKTKLILAFRLLIFRFLTHGARQKKASRRTAALRAVPYGLMSYPL